MTRKNRTTAKAKNNKQVVRQQPKQQAPPKPKPFSQAGAIIGARLGQMFNAPQLKGVGKWLGSGFGQIFGSGDYTMVGASPQYNVLTNSNQIPKFDTVHAANIVSHREYLGNIAGTTGFNNVSYPLNPGMAQTFPWLATIAQNYQEYKFHGVIFEFRSLITDFVTAGAPGAVIMATNYNADVPIYTTKQEMENSEFAVSVKPTRDLIHGIECATNQTVLQRAYVRSGNVPVGQDLRLYDLGNFQFATQSNPVADLGELWVSYCVEFSKPILPTDVGGVVYTGWTERTGVTAAIPFGNSVIVPATGTIPLIVNNTSMTFFAYPGNCYQITLGWFGSSASVSLPTLTAAGMTAYNVAFNRAGNTVNAPNNGASCNQVSSVGFYKCSLLNPGYVSLTASGNGVFPTAFSYLDMYVTGVSSAL